jgi:hypothetical protein
MMKLKVVIMRCQYTKKRRRNILASSNPEQKELQTPKAKNNRRILLFSQTPQQVGTQFPGPKVKVKAIYKISLYTCTM